MYQTVIFDFFGVICGDPLKTWAEKKGIDRYGPLAEIAHLLDGGEIDYTDYVGRLAALANQSPTELATEFSDYTVVNQPMVDLISKLHGQYKTCLLSNSHPQELQPILERDGFTNLFDTVIISADVRLTKPDLKIFVLALERTNANAATSIFIDDNLDNVVAAKQTGIESIQYKTMEALYTDLNTLGIKV